MQPTTNVNVNATANPATTTANPATTTASPAKVNATATKAKATKAKATKAKAPRGVLQAMATSMASLVKLVVSGPQAAPVQGRKRAPNMPPMPGVSYVWAHAGVRKGRTAGLLTIVLAAPHGVNTPYGATCMAHLAKTAPLAPWVAGGCNNPQAQVANTAMAPVLAQVAKALATWPVPPKGQA